MRPIDRIALLPELSNITRASFDAILSDLGSIFSLKEKKNKKLIKFN